MRTSSSIAIAALCLPLALANVTRAEEQTSLHDDFLTSAQQVKIGQLITSRYPPLTNVNFSVAIGNTVPESISIQAFSPEAEAISPKLNEVGFIVVEELIALVDKQSRKIVSVFPRWK